MRTPSPYSSRMRCSSSLVSCSMRLRPSVWAYCRFDRPMTSRMAASAPARTFSSGLRTSKAYLKTSLICHSTANSMSTMFSSPVSIRFSVEVGRGPRRVGRRAVRLAAARADHDAALVLHVDHDHVADRAGQVVVQAGLDRLAVGLAEHELDRLLVGLHAEEAGDQPDHQAEPARPARRPCSEPKPPGMRFFSRSWPLRMTSSMSGGRREPNGHRRRRDCRRRHRPMARRRRRRHRRRRHRRRPRGRRYCCSTPSFTSGPPAACSGLSALISGRAAYM